MNTSPPRPRLTVFLARESPAAVILRRGPTEHFQLISWDRSTDAIRRGQWLKGQVYEERCDLSPDGRYFVYCAAQRGGRNMTLGTEIWTAVSRPPYFTARAIWFHSDSYAGGGVFTSNRELALCGHSGRLGGSDRVASRCPFSIRAMEGRDFGGLPVLQERRELEGWLLQSDPPTDGIWGNWFVAPDKLGPIVRQKAHGEYLLRETVHSVRARLSATYNLEPGGCDLSRATWADWDRTGRMLFVDAGCLFAATPDASGAWPVEELADFSADRFEEVPPPQEAREW